LTQDERRIVVEAIEEQRAWLSRSPSQAFANTQRLAMSSPQGKLKYVEGYVAVMGRPYLHAWVSLNGKLIDLTGPYLLPESRGEESPYPELLLGLIPPGRFYRGIEFDSPCELSYIALKRGYHDSLIDDRRTGYPLLAGKNLREFLDSIPTPTGKRRRLR
jgi:hypothetical protein